MKRIIRRLGTLVLVLLILCLAGPAAAAGFETAVLPLERAGVQLHLERTTEKGAAAGRNILLVHGLTYSSHEFDVDYGDYSLVRYLAGHGYAVWCLDVAGYGRSGKVDNGFLPDSDYAAEDVHAAIRAICSAAGTDRIDVLGWSWGTVVAGRCAAAHPELIRRLVLYAPILTGLGKAEVTSAFNHNTWQNAADDFQKAGTDIDYAITEPAVAAAYLSDCWRFDGESSPNGGRKDLLTPPSTRLFEPGRIQAPTLVIYGDRDPYINKTAIQNIGGQLAGGSEVIVVHGAAHAMLMEKPYYRQFREAVLSFLLSPAPQDSPRPAADRAR